MPKMFIMRGLPGSGKSTRTKEILHKYDSYVASADTYFIRPDGTYDWNPKLLKKAHFWCWDQASKYCLEGILNVIIDNTNIRRADFQAYLDLAEQYKYEVEEVVVGKFDEESCKIYAERNVHGCPVETILKRAKEFEV